jgi:hypothetical protein
VLDDQLLESVARGDRSALEKLYLSSEWNKKRDSGVLVKRSVVKIGSRRATKLT